MKASVPFTELLLLLVAGAAIAAAASTTTAAASAHHQYALVDRGMLTLRELHARLRKGFALIGVRARGGGGGGGGGRVRSGGGAQCVGG
jgi:hypothetical protein